MNTINRTEISTDQELGHQLFQLTPIMGSVYLVKNPVNKSNPNEEFLKVDRAPHW